MEKILNDIKTAIIVFGIIISILLLVIAVFQYRGTDTLKKIDNRQFMDKIYSTP